MQSLWIGESLSAMEQLCIASFLHHGHAFHLYAYGEVAGAPQGTAILDANEIIPADKIFRYQNGSFSGFSNFFRFKLLLDRGGWWVDLDMVCLKPFDFLTAYVFSAERDGDACVPNSGAIKAPRGSDFSRYCWEVCQSKDSAQLRWGETGPRLVGEALQELGLQGYLQGPETFCPIRYRSWEQVLDPEFNMQWDRNTRAVHLWQELWRRNRRDKNQRYPPKCLYEQLRSAYLDP